MNNTVGRFHRYVCDILTIFFHLWDFADEWHFIAGCLNLVHSIYTIICLKSVCLATFADGRSQFLLDRLGRCLKLIVSSGSTSCHEFASQFGLAFFYTRKTSINYRECRVSRIWLLNEKGRNAGLAGDRSTMSGKHT